MKKYIHWIVLALSLFLIVSMGRSTLQLLGRGDAIKEAEVRVRELEAEQARLLEVKEQVESQEFMEKEAREKLGLAKPGEVVVVLPSDEVLRRLAPEFDQEHFVEELPIYERWIRLFF